MTFEETLAAWLPGQRWFAGKGTPITGLAVTSQTTLASGDPGHRHGLVSAVPGRAGGFARAAGACPYRPGGPGPDRLRRPARPGPHRGAAGGDGRGGVDRAAALRPAAGRAHRHRPGEP